MRKNVAAGLKSVDLKWLKRPEHQYLGQRGRPSMPPRWSRRTTRPGVPKIERKWVDASKAWASKNGKRWREETRRAKEKKELLRSWNVMVESTRRKQHLERPDLRLWRPYPPTPTGELIKFESCNLILIVLNCSTAKTGADACPGIQFIHVSKTEVEESMGDLHDLAFSGARHLPGIRNVHHMEVC